MIYELQSIMRQLIIERVVAQCYNSRLCSWNSHADRTQLSGEEPWNLSFMPRAVGFTSSIFLRCQRLAQRTVIPLPPCGMNVYIDDNIVSS